MIKNKVNVGDCHKNEIFMKCSRDMVNLLIDKVIEMIDKKKEMRELERN
jgi:hypothetical protein